VFPKASGRFPTHRPTRSKPKIQNNSDTLSLLVVVIPMSFLVDLSKSLLILPRDYTGVRPHHVLVLYALGRAVSATSLYRRITNALLNVMSQTSESLIPLVYQGLVPDVLIRFGIRVQLYNHLTVLQSESAELELQQKLDIVQELYTLPIAIETEAANDQHYEVPAKFYDLCLGPCKKYSSGLWPTPTTTFEESEVLMLDLYCQRANVQDGMHIVDLGTCTRCTLGYTVCCR
jgi:hypothetical protein